MTEGRIYIGIFTQLCVSNTSTIIKTSFAAGTYLKTNPNYQASAPENENKVFVPFNTQVEIIEIGPEKNSHQAVKLKTAPTAQSKLDYFIYTPHWHPTPVNKIAVNELKICIDAGHSRPPRDTGAVGFLKEDEVAKDVSKHLYDILSIRGHKVLLTKPTDGSSVTASLSDRCEQSNDFDADLFVSIHCNASKPTNEPMGTEVFAVSTKGIALATQIEKSISGLGFKSRGVKNGANLYVLKYTDCPSVLVELFFIDSKADCNLYNKFGSDTLAKAIADAIDNKLSSVPTTNEVVASKPAVISLVSKAAKESTPQVLNLSNIIWSDPNCKISKYFTVGEATKGEITRTPHPNSKEASNILKLAAELDKLREAFGSPIGVTSWNRPEAINRAVGGAKDSQHKTGGAVDIYPLNGMDIYEFQKWCDKHWYGGFGAGASKGFVHLDIRSGGGFMTGGQKGPRWNY